jgi:hypothetical protein
VSMNCSSCVSLNSCISSVQMNLMPIDAYKVVHWSSRFKCVERVSVQQASGVRGLRLQDHVFGNNENNSVHLKQQS